MTQDEMIELAKQANFEWLTPDVRTLILLVAAKEREACAKVADELPAPDIYNDTDKSMWDVTCMDCATAIRARGQA